MKNPTHTTAARSRPAAAQPFRIPKAAWWVAAFLFAGLLPGGAANSVAPMGTPGTTQDPPRFSLSERYVKLFRQIIEIAEWYHFQGRLDAALRFLDSADGLAQAEEAPGAARARLLVERGRILTSKIFTTNQGHERARQVLQSALEAAAASGDEAAWADAADQLGLLDYVGTMTTGGKNYDAARDYFEQALAKRRALSDFRGLSESYFHLGLVRERLGEEGPAEQAYQRALQLAVTHGFKLEQSYAVRHLAALAARRGEFDRALELFQQSLKLRQEVGFRLFLPSSFNAVGQTLLALERPQEALPYFEKAFRLAEEMRETRIAVATLILLGDAHLALDQPERARKHFEKARGLAETIQYKVGLSLAAERLKQFAQ